jgi:hypothetical protein
MKEEIIKIIDSIKASEDTKERLKEEVQCMINEEYVQESYRKLKLYEHQQKTGRPAFVRIL